MLPLSLDKQDRPVPISRWNDLQGMCRLTHYLPASLKSISSGNTEFNSYSCTCSVCGCAWCYLCNWEPHWPMSCEQFKRWSERWDTQCEFNVRNT
ncbi:hypothetical protein ANCCAN_23807 [Ancylostoma caninum]|uniref:IBR domain-containing protein n=1 Tax=Ancylostoma caninum TaxID=29170 RepID=A0A368FHX1_ANCCA|nr:hypothetical protein ANCCAN_23807 [Ancylostoma caninum]